MVKCILICPNCKNRFPSPIHFGSALSFEKSSIQKCGTKCPNCGKDFELRKRNMIFQEVRFTEQKK